MPPAMKDVAVAVAAKQVQTILDAMPSFCQTTLVKQKLIEKEQVAAEVKAAELLAAWAWLPGLEAADLPNMEPQRADECKQVLERAWGACWNNLPQVAQDHLDAADMKAEWMQRDGLAMVRKQLLEEAPYRFHPENEPENEEDENIVASMTLPMEKAFQESLDAKVDAVLQVMPEGLRTKDIKENLRKESYWGTLRSTWAAAMKSPADAPEAAIILSQGSERSQANGHGEAFGWRTVVGGRGLVMCCFQEPTPTPEKGRKRQKTEVWTGPCIGRGVT